MKLQTEKTCKDCLFLIQEWKLDWVNNDQNFKFFMNLDQYCRLCDIFKSSDGYCDMWEPV